MRGSRLKFRSLCSSAVPLVAVGGISIGAGFYHQNAGALALGVLFFFSPLVVWWLLKRAVRELHVSRLAPESVYEGDSVEVRLRLENRSRFPLFFPEISEIFSPEIHAQKDVLFPERLAAGEVMERCYRGDCLLPRGVYAIGPTALSVSDPFGWFLATKELAAPRPIKVYPRISDLWLRERLGACISHVVEELSRPQHGDSNDFLSVREYRVGDPLRRVHWRLSAHRDYPVVREFARTSTGDLCVFVDTYRLALTGIGRTSSIEYGVKIAASLSAKALRRGHHVQLVAGTKRSANVEPGAGSVHFQRILDVVVGIKPTGETPLTDLLADHARDIRAGSTVLVPISPYLYGDPTLEGALASWRRRGVRVVAVVFDTTTFQNLWALQNQDGSQYDSDTCRARLKAIGIESFSISCGADLQHVFADRGLSETRSAS